MQDRVFQPVSGPLYDAENNMKTAPQLRLRNEWEGRTQTRSKRNSSCRFQRNRCGFLPLITVWLQVRVLPRPPIFACSASYGTADHPVSRALDTADRAYVLDQGGGGLPRWRARTAGRQ